MSSFVGRANGSRECIISMSSPRTRLCENAHEPRMPRIVFSIAFFRQKLPVQLVSTSTKSRWKFYTQVRRRSFHTTRHAGTHTPWPRVLARWLTASAPADSGGYGSPRARGRRIVWRDRTQRIATDPIFKQSKQFQTRIRIPAARCARVVA
jgi:hypothetical protein